MRAVLYPTSFRYAAALLKLERDVRQKQYRSPLAPPVSPHQRLIRRAHGEEQGQRQCLYAVQLLLRTLRDPRRGHKSKINCTKKKDPAASVEHARCICTRAISRSSWARHPPRPASPSRYQALSRKGSRRHSRYANTERRALQKHFRARALFNLRSLRACANICAAKPSVARAASTMREWAAAWRGTRF